MTNVVLPAGFDDLCRRVRLAVVMALAGYCPLDKRPEVFDGVGVDESLSLGNRMIDSEVWNPFVHASVATVLVSHQDCIVSVYKTAQERFKRLARYLVGRAGHDFAAACQCADDGLLLGSSSALGRVIVVAVRLTRLAADVGFVRLDNAVQENAVVYHPLPDLHSHTVGTSLIDSQVAGQLVTGDAFLGVQQNGNSEEPLLERYSGSLEDSAGQDVVAVVAAMAVPTSNTVVFAFARDLVGTTERAGRLISPSCLFQMVDASLLCGELLKNRNQIHRVFPVDYSYSIPDVDPFVKPQTAYCLLFGPRCWPPLVRDLWNWPLSAMGCTVLDVLPCKGHAQGVPLQA